MYVTMMLLSTEPVNGVWPWSQRIVMFTDGWKIKSFEPGYEMNKIGSWLRSAKSNNYSLMNLF